MPTPRPEPPPASLLGGRYELGAPLGAGGMGTVVEAHDQLLERRVAIKRLPPELEADPLARARLRREALAAAALDHPYICKIHEISEADGRLFIVMEYVEGETLHALAGRSLVPLPHVVELATEIIEALEEAHRRGVVHRDLKPANIMVTVGHTPEEALAEVETAKHLWIDAARAAGKPVPAPRYRPAIYQAR